MRLAVISDLYYTPGANPAHPERRGEFAPILLRRALEYLRIRGDIDLICLAGDLLDNPAEADLLADIAAVLGSAPCRVLAIPGNHDPAPELFYRYLERRGCVDAGPVRVIPFIDPATPGCNAERLPEEFERARRLAAGHDGPVVHLQHVPLYPAERAGNRYGYRNADATIEAMRETGAVVSVSGHQHEGVPDYCDGACCFTCTGALCEAPFAFDILTIAPEGSCSRETVRLRLPDGLALRDNHTHTPFAYCNENMDWRIERELMTALNLDRLAITEHSAHLLFQPDDYRELAWYRDGLDFPGLADRTGAYRAYLDAATAGDARFIRGVETDIACDGRLILPERLERTAALRLGAVHSLDGLSGEAARQHFLFLVTRLVESGRIDVLAHPFRVFARRGLGEAPAELFAPVVRLLKDHGVAAEINFHCNRPEPEFFRLCLEAGVKLSLGSDAHNLYETGFLTPHLDFLKALGCDGALDAILV